MKCVVILSGGPDSVTTAYWAKNQGFQVHAVTFNYGQRAQIEIERAKAIARELVAEHKVIDLSSLMGVYKGVSSLVDRNMEVTSEFTTPIIVPFRNGIFIAVAVAYADSIGAHHIFYGAQKGDALFYPDCRVEFYEAFQEAARRGTEKPFIITSPFHDTPKADVIREAVSMGVPLEKTWSCYLEGPIHCGICESCLNRRRAFKEAGVPDPTLYKE